MKPCSRCEQELPESSFFQHDDPYCKRCTREVNKIMEHKYSVIEAAYYRAKLRRVMKQRLSGLGATGDAQIAAGT
jgi:predicted amidophosphoribosyltransferase